MTEYSYTVTYIPTAADISNDVEEITVNDTGSGEVTSAKLILNASGGKYATLAPILDQFDKIRIQITDDASNTYDRIFEVDNLVPLQSGAEGTKLEVDLLGIERHLQRLHFARQYYFSSAFAVTKDIIDIYNANKGSTQPLVEKHDDVTFNELPDWTSNTYEFNISEKFCYDGIAEVIDRLGSTVQAGGAGDFFEFYLAKHPTDNNKLNFKGFSSGSKPASPVTISEVLALNPAPQEGGIESISGTIVAGWGAENFGSLPPDTSKFAGELEAFDLHPTWKDQVPYKIGARVQWNGRHYERITSDVAPPYPATPPDFSAQWQTKLVENYIGTLKYSPWTDGQANAWKNNGSNPSPTIHGAETGFNKRGCWDSNLVINDTAHARIDAEARVNNATNISANYLYGAASSGVYRGFRVLVDPVVGTLAGVFAGRDKNNVVFSGNVAQFDGTDWVVVILHPDTNEATKDGDQVGIIGEGKLYEKAGGQWGDVSDDFDGVNDCFHIYNGVANVQGFNTTPKGAGDYGDTSAVEFTYNYTPFSASDFFNLITEGTTKTPGYYQIGAWACFRFPFPHSTYNGVATLGSFYGNNSTKKEPVTLDSNNFSLTHSAKTGFNNNEAEDLGPLTALQFFLRFRWTDDADVLVPFTANYKFRCAIYDTSGNMVVQDFNVPFNGVWTQITLPLSQFQLYRARLPIRWGNIQQNIFPRQLEILNQFQWKNVRMLVIQWQEPYDDEGRFNPAGTRPVTQPAGIAANRVTKLAVDTFHFVKPLLAVSGQDTTRALETRFMQEPQISNYVQLKQAVLSQVEIEKFRHKQFDVKTEGKIDINFGDSFFLSNPNLVSDSDNGANTIKLVAKHITYTISKPAHGPGTFERLIMGVKRFS